MVVGAWPGADRGSPHLPVGKGYRRGLWGGKRQGAGGSVLPSWEPGSCLSCCGTVTGGRRRQTFPEACSSQGPFCAKDTSITTAKRSSEEASIFWQAASISSTVV